MFLTSKALHADLGILLLRVGASAGMFFNHGLVKLQNFGDRMESFYDPFGLGSTVSLSLIVFAEAFCAILVLLGLWTRLSTIPLIIGMATAAFGAMGGKGFAKQEMPILFMLIFLTIFLTGSGKYSLGRIGFR